MADTIAKLKTLTDSNDFQSFLDDMKNRGEKRTGMFKERYRKCMGYCYGNQLTEEELDDDKPHPIINIILPGVFQEISYLSANNPSFKTTGVENTDIELANSVGSSLQGLCNRKLDFQVKLMQALYDGHLAGYYIGYWYWNPASKWNKQEQKWEGQIEFNVIDPSYFGCDPDIELASDINSKAKFITIEYWMDKSEAASIWPTYKDHLLETDEDYRKNSEFWIPGSASGSGASGEKVDESGFDRATGEWAGQLKRSTVLNPGDFARSLSDMLAGKASDRDSGEGEDGRLVRVQLFFYECKETEEVGIAKRKYTTEEIQAGQAHPVGYDARLSKFVDLSKPMTTDDDSPSYKEWVGPFPEKTEKEAFERPLYPNGRYSVRLDKNIIVTDQEYQYETWPIAVGANYMLPHIWQGLNSVEMTMTLQDYVNKIHALIANNAEHHSNTQWVIETGALRGDDDPTQASVFVPNNSGSIIEANPGGSEKIRRDPAPEMPRSIFDLENMIRDRAQDIQGVQDVGMGRASKGGENTLGELQMLNQNTQLRTAMQATLMHKWIQQIGYGLAELMQAHYEPGRWLRQLGPDRDAVQISSQWTPEMGSAKFDIDIIATSTLPYDPNEEIQKYKLATDIIGEPMFEPFLNKLGIENVDDIMAQHQIVGPLKELLEMAAEMGMAPEDLKVAVGGTLQQLQEAAQLDAAQQGDVQNGQKQNEGSGPGPQRQPIQ